MEILFTILNASVLPFWLLLAFFVSNNFTQKYLFTYKVHIAYAIFYTIFIVWGFVSTWGGEGGMSSLNSLRISFENDKVLLAAWAHYLVFDLFVGTWIAKTSLKEKLPKWLSLPSLLFTLMLGPIGFLMFLLGRKLLKSKD